MLGTLLSGSRNALLTEAESGLGGDCGHDLLIVHGSRRVSVSRTDAFVDPSNDCGTPVSQVYWQILVL